MKLFVVFVLTTFLFSAGVVTGGGNPSRQIMQAVYTPTNVLGGESAPVDRFPYVCHIEYTGNGGSATCAGMLVAPRWVMTAAHCLHEEDGVRTIERISCGSHQHRNTRARNEFEGVEVRVHDMFDPPATQLEYDIALVRLDRAAPFAVPSLATVNAASPDDQAYVAGWGEFDNSGQLSRDLQLAEVYVVDNDECSEMWSERYPSLNIDERRLCAGETEGRICYGDSGGPLILAHSPQGAYPNGDPSRDVIIGISSFGECGGEFPSVFTRVGYFLDWIEETIRPQSRQRRSGRHLL